MPGGGLPYQARASEQLSSIRDLLAEGAQSGTERDAIVSPGLKPLSYEGLLKQLDYVSETLRSLGVEQSDRVALVAPEGPATASAFLGVASASACAPLNPRYQEREFEFFLSDLEARAVVVQAPLGSPVRRAAGKLGIPLLELQASRETAGEFRLEGALGAEPSATAPGGGPEDVALALYTSGTTSRPKLVPLTQSNLCLSARNISESLELTRGDLCLNVMPLFHVHGLMAGLLASLAAGSSVVCPPGFLAPRFFDWVEEFRPTWYSGVPTMHRAVLDEAASRRQVVEACRVRFVRSCSAPLAPSVMEALEELFDAPVVEAYGMTEASHQISSNPLPPGVRKPGSVGLPTGCQVAVLSPAGGTLRPGETGEIALRGLSVTRGYENDPEANRSAFTDGWFRTGDEGYIDEDGYIFLTGRLKELINRGGEKISPREVEEVLVGHPGVADAVAFAVDHPELGEEVAACAVRRAGAQAGEADVRLFASERLASFKVPRRVFFVEELPKGPTGKLKRVGLAERLGVGAEDLELAASSSTKAAPRSDLERQLASIWASVLGRDEVGIDDHFFLYGGTSIQAALLVARIQKALGFFMPLELLASAPTVRKLAEAMESQDLLEQVPSLIPVRPEADGPTLFFTQQFHAALLEPHLGGNWAVYGFQMRPGGRGKTPASLEELASKYAQEILTLRPEGPYHLLGFCSGATVAFEVARQLEKLGRQVEFLGLIDGYAPGHLAALGGAHLLTGLASSASDCLIRLWPFFKGLVGLKPRRIASSLYYILPIILKESLHIIYIIRGRPLPKALRQRRDTLRGLAADYKPSPYGGRAVLFKPSREPLGYGQDPLMGWGPLVAGGLEVMEVAGYHRTLISKPRHMAEALQKGLDALIG